MADENTQTQENQDANSQSQNHAENQGVDLESLLSEYDEDTGGESETNQSTANQENQPSGNGGEPSVDPNEISEVLNYVREQRQRDQVKEQQESIQDAVQTIKEHEALKELPDWLVEGALYSMGNKDKRLEQAYKNRHQNPEGWKRVLKSVGDKLATDMQQQPDGKLTEDRDAARAAVSGQKGSNTSDDNKPDPQELNQLSDEEFERKKEAGEFV